MSWYLQGIVMAAACFGFAMWVGYQLIAEDPPLWGALLLWPGAAGLAAFGVRIVVDMVRNDRRVRENARQEWKP